MQPLYRFILHVIISFKPSLSPILRFLTCILLTNTSKNARGVVYPLVRIAHRWTEGCRKAKGSCPFDEKDNKMQERFCMTVNYPVLRNILQPRG